MGQLDGVLNPDEKLLFRTRLHWLPCAPSALAVALLGAAILAALAVFARHPVVDLFAREPLMASILALGWCWSWSCPWSWSASWSPRTSSG